MRRQFDSREKRAGSAIEIPSAHKNRENTSGNQSGISLGRFRSRA